MVAIWEWSREVGMVALEDFAVHSQFCKPVVRNVNQDKCILEFEMFLDGAEKRPRANMRRLRLLFSVRINLCPLRRFNLTAEIDQCVVGSSPPTWDMYHKLIGCSIVTEEGRRIASRPMYEALWTVYWTSALLMYFQWSWRRSQRFSPGSLASRLSSFSVLFRY